MPWSDDTRCLYCDGKLPLFRKLAHGQFCSKAHQKKYWDEQQALVVERLHQTHNDIQAYKPPGSIERILGPVGPEPENDYSFLDADASSILGPTEPVRVEPPVETLAPGKDDGPAIAGFLATVVDPVSGSISPFVATGSLEFASAIPPEIPAWTAPEATLRLQAVADYLWAWLSQPVDAAHAEIASQTAIAFSPRVEQPSHTLSTAVPNPVSEVVPALEQQFKIAGPEPHSGGIGMQANDPAPVPAPGQILRGSHSLTASHAGLRSLQKQFSISGPTPRETAIAPNSAMVMAAAAGALDVTFPVLAARPRGPAFEISSGYEPPLVKDLRKLSFTANRPASTALRNALQGDYIPIKAARPGMSLSSYPAVSAHADFPVGGLQQLAVAITALQPVAAGELRSLERYTSETQQPVMAGLAVPMSGLVPCKLQALELLAQPAHDLPHGDVQPAALAMPEAAQPEPKLIGAPLAPDSLSLVGLPWNLEVSGAPVWDPTPSRALAPHVSAMLPESGATVMTMTMEPELEAIPLIEGPIDIPSQAGHVAMQHAFTVSPVDMRGKPGALVRNVIPEPLQGQQLLPQLWLKLQKVEFAPPVVEGATVPGAVIEAEAARRGGLAGIRSFWTNAPRDLKILACAIPVLIGLAFHSLPKVSVTAPPTDGIQGGFRQAVSAQFASFKQSIANRAAVALDEDFRGGIDDWLSRTGATAEWSFNATGFVQPGPLALYEPSLKLTDYQMQFLGMIDDKAMSWVARAGDFENYYVIKLVVLKPGPLPTIGLTRYAVIDGKPVDRVDRPVPINARADSIYRIRMDVHGSNFALEVQGQMIDSWNEPRLKRGGVGFFTGRGEKSSIRWVQITHQYDVLGRLCAYLAPYEF